jgi:casein kinase II subunit beta
MKYENKNDSDEEISSDGWINWFCDIEGHEFFVDVDEDFIRDSFNLYGLKNLIQRYDEALEMILSTDIPDSEDLTNQK